jgi:hypothetical protein
LASNTLAIEGGAPCLNTLSKRFSLFVSRAQTIIFGSIPEGVCPIGGVIGLFFSA